MYVDLIGRLYGPPDSWTRKLFAAKNAALFAMNLMLAAKGLGLETHSMDGFDEAGFKREFQIPDDKLIPMLVAVGYLRSRTKLLPRDFRRPLNEFVSFDSLSKVTVERTSSPKTTG